MKYKIWYEENKQLKTIVVNDKNNFPKNIIKIKELQPFKIPILFKNNREIIELFYEFSLMLEAKLPLKETIELLLQTTHKNRINQILLSMKQALIEGKPLYIILEQYKSYIGALPIVFFKLGEQNSNIENSIQALYKLLNEFQYIKQEILKTLKYPFILLISLFASINIIFTFVLPRFSYIFTQFGDNLPKSTKILLDIKYCFDHYGLFFILLLGFIIIFLYKLYKMYKYNFDKFILMKIPYFSNMYRYIVLYKIFLSLHLIVKSKFQFQNALKNILFISDNLYIKKSIENIINNISKGISISESFKEVNIFDNTTIKLLFTAEKTNKMEQILDDITQLYKKRLTTNIKNFTTILEPLLIFIIASIILWLVLAIMTPIWQLSQVL